MTKLLPILIPGLLWAYLTQQSTCGIYGRRKQSLPNRIVFAMLVLTLALPIALRCSYNDTRMYIQNFVNGETLPELLSAGTLRLPDNPAFAVYSALVRSFTDNHVFFFLFPAFFCQYSWMRFLRRYCPNFVLGLFLYFCLGSYTFSIAAMKQSVAAAVALWAVDGLIRRRYIRFWLLVMLAALFHSYALAFAILPLLLHRPWSWKTAVLLAGVCFVLGHFDGTMAILLELADRSGKYVSESELIGTDSVNPLRLAVYAVTPLLLLLLRRHLFGQRGDRQNNLLANLSILTAAILSLGLVSGANLFARMAQYFEFGTICILPWVLDRPFEARSARLLTVGAVLCFLVYLIYAQAFWMPFDVHFSRYTLAEFAASILYP